MGNHRMDRFGTEGVLRALRETEAEREARRRERLSLSWIRLTRILERGREALNLDQRDRIEET